MFGSFIKETRLNHGLSLRAFAKLIGEDASNWSKIERGFNNPPKSEDKLKKIEMVLHLNTEEVKHMKDLAKAEIGEIPDYIRSDSDVMELLPAFFRTVENVKPTKEELQELIDSLRRIRR